jgi:CheY-like chemotaxis protein
VAALTADNIGMSSMERLHPVLLVEDNEDIRAAMAMVLRLAGFATEEAEHGEQALKKIRDGRCPCVIRLDLMMPVMDGTEFRRHQLRHSEAADVPTIVCSALDDVDVVAAPLRATAVLRKPIDPHALVALVEQHC